MTTPRSRLVESLLEAYRRGIFPMADPATGEMHWLSPSRRGIIPLGTRGAGRFHVPRTVRRCVRRGVFLMRTDTAFEEVIRGCAQPRPGPPGSDPSETWIDERIIAAYTALHRAGHAHSVEAWLAPVSGPAAPTRPEGVLVGGIYGVRIGAAFFAESMFCRPGPGTNASSVCLVHLVHHLRRLGCTLLDTQFSNPHIARFGCVEVARGRFLAMLDEALARETTWLPFEPERTVEEV